MLPPADRTLALALATLAAEAGRLILDIAAGGAKSRIKLDGSPVTIADERSEELLISQLTGLLPGVPVLAEEQASAGTLPMHHAEMVVIDPLDGTKEFIARNGEFTVNIALIEDGRPVLGVVYLPATDACYAGLGGKAERRIGNGALETIVARAAPKNGLVMAISRSHADGEVERAQARGLNIAGTIVAGSSLKFCRIA